MPSNAVKGWSLTELIPFLQRVFAHRVNRHGTVGRDWNKAWYKVIQSASSHVRNAAAQHYSSTPFRTVARLYQALVDPQGSNDPAMARMRIESCAIVFIQHVTIHGPFPLHSRQLMWPLQEFALAMQQEEVVEQQFKQQGHHTDPIESWHRDWQIEALHRLFYEGRWLEMIDYRVERGPVANHSFETLERAKGSHDAVGDDHLMLGGMSEPQDLAEDVVRYARPILTKIVADRRLSMCDPSETPRSYIRRSSM